MSNSAQIIYLQFSAERAFSTTSTFCWPFVTETEIPGREKKPGFLFVCLQYKYLMWD